jgi:hypothetical protein
MNRTIKEATVKRYHDETHGQLREHFQQFLIAYNFAKLTLPNVSRPSSPRWIIRRLRPITSHTLSTPVKIT